MKKHLIPTLISCAIALPLLFSASAHAKIVCWTNSDGIRECGNAVPPEYAQKEVRTINERGMTTEVKERAKTPEELEAERTRLAEQQKREEEEAELKRKQETYDQVLLSTYLNEQDIIRSRDRQAATIDGTIELTQVTINKLQEKLDEERKKAANYERLGKPLPERTQEDIDSLQAQIDSKQRFITAKQEEKQRLHEKSEAELTRFRELKGNGVKLR